MKKIILVVVSLVVLLALGIVYFVYRDARYFFTVDQKTVNDAVTAMNNESPGSRRAYEFALERVEAAEDRRPWVSAAEIAELREKLEQGKAASQSKYPAEASAWKLGESYTYAVITCQFSSKPDTFMDWYPKAKGFAWFLDVNPSLSEFEFQYQKQDPFDKQRFVRERLDAALEEVGTKSGEKNQKLFRMASVSILAFLAAQQRDTFPDESASYPAEIARLGTETGLPENLWRPYATALEQKESANTLVDLLTEMQNGVTKHLGVTGPK